jgi:ubiquinone/menaquinone biosynthesis C-methylase UbiE
VNASPPVSAVPGITDEAIARTFAPYVIEEFDAGSPRWAQVIRGIEEKLDRPSPPWEHWLTPDGQRTTTQVRDRYDEKWARLNLAEELRGSRAGWFEWRDRRMRASSIGYKRVAQLLLTRVIEWQQPRSVVEVGFGWGLHLLTLALQFPEIRFAGVELTEAGVRAARALATEPEAIELLSTFAIGSVKNRDAGKHIDLRQGSAEALPLEDKSADMVITVLALEQMEQIREAALRELARVARRHVVMIEPFRDWNSDGRYREYIRRLDYWTGAVDDLAAFGLVPVLTHADIPQKLTSRVGLVVARVANSGSQG